jgi:glucokinase
MLSLGFDIGGTAVKAGAVDEDFNIIRKTAFPTPKGDIDALCSLIEKTGNELLNDEALCTVGVTVPGSVDANGGIIDAWNLGLRDVPLKELISKRLSAKRIVVKNDADAAADAELHFGALKGVETGLMLTLGTGVGGSIIINGNLFNGGLKRGTELGHAMIDRGGRRCACGHKGCIETLCSATALKRLGEKACKEKKGMIYSLSKEGARVDARLVIECAKQGDQTALELFDKYTDALSDAVASFVNVIDPEVIVIGGGVSGAGDFLLDVLREKVPPRTFFGSCGRFAAASAGNDAGILGAVI